MQNGRPSQDIRPLSEFRASVATFVEQVQTTQRPLVLTQHGRSAAILIAVDAYEALVERAELAEDVQTAEAQVAGSSTVGVSARSASRFRMKSPRLGALPAFLPWAIPRFSKMSLKRGSPAT